MTEAHSRCIGGPSPILRALLFYSTAFWGDLEKRHNTVGGRINFAWFVFTEFHDKLKLNLCSSRHPKKKILVPPLLQLFFIQRSGCWATTTTWRVKLQISKDIFENHDKKTCQTPFKPNWLIKFWIRTNDVCWFILYVKIKK